MSRDILGNKQTIIIHNCLINDKNHTTQTNNRIHKKKDKHYERKLLTNKNKLLGNDFQNEETQVLKN